MSHRIIRSSEFRAECPWGALDIANLNGITVRLHWTDKPYHWHINDGKEVFAVMQGIVEMHYRFDGIEHVAHLQAGDIFLQTQEPNMSRIRKGKHGFWSLKMKAACKGPKPE